MMGKRKAPVPGGSSRSNINHKHTKYKPLTLDRLTKIDSSTELREVFIFLKNNTSTGSMISEATGIKQKNITRYKRKLERVGLLKVLFRAPCQITGHKAAYLSCNPVLIKNSYE